jgi:hypothetical protein
MLAIADQANDEGIAWPSAGSLEERTGMTKQSIALQVGKLVDSGALVIAKQSLTGNVYRIGGVTAGVHPKPAKKQQERGESEKIILEEYHRWMTKLPRVVQMTSKRRTAMAREWVRHPMRSFWDGYFELCSHDPFLNGTGPYGNTHANWCPDFDYLMREGTIVRVIEQAHAQRARGEA